MSAHDDHVVHRIMQRLCELSSEPPSDDTLTVHHDTLQRILFDEIGETDGNPPSTESSGVSRGSDSANKQSSTSTIPLPTETPVEPHDGSDECFAVYKVRDGKFVIEPPGAAETPRSVYYSRKEVWSILKLAERNQKDWRWGLDQLDEYLSHPDDVGTRKKNAICLWP